MSFLKKLLLSVAVLLLSDRAIALEFKGEFVGGAIQQTGRHDGPHNQIRLLCVDGTARDCRAFQFVYINHYAHRVDKLNPHVFRIHEYREFRGQIGQAKRAVQRENRGRQLEDQEDYYLQMYDRPFAYTRGTSLLWMMFPPIIIGPLIGDLVVMPFAAIVVPYQRAFQNLKMKHAWKKLFGGGVGRVNQENLLFIEEMIGEFKPAELED